LGEGPRNEKIKANPDRLGEIRATNRPGGEERREMGREREKQFEQGTYQEKE